MKNIYHVFPSNRVYDEYSEIIIVGDNEEGVKKFLENYFTKSQFPLKITKFGKAERNFINYCIITSKVYTEEN